MQTIPALAAEWVVVIFIAALAAIVLIKIWKGTISLDGLLSEMQDPPPAPGIAAPPAKGSMSRLQLLLFTVVIAGLYLTLSLEAGALIDIPNQVLGLLGISGGSYVVAKGIQANK